MKNELPTDLRNAIILFIFLGGIWIVSLLFKGGV